MLLTHLFESTNALSRAHYWLNLHGFEVTPSDLARDGRPRLALCLSMAQVPAALALIESIELADHEGQPGLPEVLALLAHAKQDQALPSACSTRSPIHWGPREEAQAEDPHVEAVRDYMAGYHE